MWEVTSFEAKNHRAASTPMSSQSSRRVTALPVRLDIFTSTPSSTIRTIWISSIERVPSG